MLQPLISQRFNIGAELAEIINDSSFYLLEVTLMWGIFETGRIPNEAVLGAERREWAGVVFQERELLTTAAGIAVDGSDR